MAKSQLDPYAVAREATSEIRAAIRSLLLLQPMETVPLQLGCYRILSHKLGSNIPSFGIMGVRFLTIIEELANAGEIETIRVRQLPTCGRTEKYRYLLALKS